MSVGLWPANAWQQLTGQVEGRGRASGRSEDAGWPPAAADGRRFSRRGRLSRGGGVGAAPRLGILGPQHPRRGPRRRSAAHLSEPWLTSRRGSRDSNALGWLPGPEEPTGA